MESKIFGSEETIDGQDFRSRDQFVGLCVEKGSSHTSVRKITESKNDLPKNLSKNRSLMVYDGILVDLSLIRRCWLTREHQGTAIALMLYAS